jgi:hypothetical protein
MSKITPHKGGRTSDFHIRIKPETLATIKQVAKSSKVKSQADVIEALFKIEFEALIEYVDTLTDYGANDVTE